MRSPSSAPIMKGQYLVIYRTDRDQDGDPGEWHLSSKRHELLQDAVNYATGVHESREARVLKVVVAF